MDLTELASSQLPNAAAGGVALLLAVFALIWRDHGRWLYVVLGLASAAVIMAKNLSYEGLVSGVEGNLDAHHSYAAALFWVVVAQLTIGGVLVLTATFSKRVTWLAVFAGLANGYAALAMNGWREAYLDDKADVQYALWSPPLHWAALIGLAVTLVIAVITLMRRRPRAGTP
jgi:hypothetical protein